MKFDGKEQFTHKRSGRGFSKFCYTVKVVADLSGRSLWSVRRDVRLGSLDMDDFMKVAEYVKKHQDRAKAKAAAQLPGVKGR